MSKGENHGCTRCLPETESSGALSWVHCREEVGGGRGQFWENLDDKLKGCRQVRVAEGLFVCLFCCRCFFKTIETCSDLRFKR